MLGWHISIYRQQGAGDTPARTRADAGERVAVWQSGHDGIDWLRELVAQGKAKALGGNGYPYLYTATTQHLLPRIADGPPGARPNWQHGPSDLLDAKWLGKTTIDRSLATACRPDEWLLVEAWDES
jgi:hypothetical protein